MSAITKSTATVYRSPTNGRRYLTKRAAIKAEALALIRKRYPSERSETDDSGRCTYGGWRAEQLPRFDVLLRRLIRLIKVTK